MSRIVIVILQCSTNIHRTVRSRRTAFTSTGETRANTNAFSGKPEGILKKQILNYALYLSGNKYRSIFIAKEP
jgi:hypothetical protein